MERRKVEERVGWQENQMIRLVSNYLRGGYHSEFVAIRRSEFAVVEASNFEALTPTC